MSRCLSRMCFSLSIESSKQRRRHLILSNTILFHDLVKFLEQEIAQRKRKRIFASDEHLGLSPSTIKRVVEVRTKLLFIRY